MDREQLLFRALGGEDPGIVPTLSILADANITAQVLKDKPGVLLKMLRSRPGGGLADRLAGPVSRLFNPGMLMFGNQVAMMSHSLGFDGVFLIYWRGRLIDRAHIEDAFGRLFDMTDDGFGNVYPMYRDGVIRKPEEWRSYPRPGVAEYAWTQAAVYRLWRLAWRKKIAIVPFIGPGVWENSWQPMGFSRFIALMRKDPDFVKEVAVYFGTLMVASIDAYCRAGARVLAVTEDLAYRSGPMLSPEKIDGLYGSWYRRMTETAHRHGARIMIHCCGNTEDLLEYFIRWGFDGAHAFEPPAGNDLRRAREAVGERLCLVGNIDVTRVLTEGTRTEVERAVRDAIRDAEGGGFILTPAHTHPSVRAQNVRWMRESARAAVAPARYEDVTVDRGKLKTMEG